jgi:hypothetical protein
MFSAAARRLRRARAAGVLVLGMAMAALAVAGPAAADPPLTNPALVAVQGGWVASLYSAQDRPECLGRYTAFDSSTTSFDQYRESKETYIALFGSSDPRFQGSGVHFTEFYLHMIRDITVTSGENGAYDGSYAIFDDSGNAIAQGSLQGVSRATAGETMNGLLFGGQVLRPSGATIGRPHLVANFEGSFDEDTNSNHTTFSGNFGGLDSNYQRPAVVVGGGCTGNYAVRPVLLSSTTSSRLSAIAPGAAARGAAYVKRLYEMTRGLG